SASACAEPGSPRSLANCPKSCATLLNPKIRGRRRGTPPPPIRPGPVGGHGEGRGRVVSAGMGCYTHPPGSLRRRGRRLPAGRPELVSSAPAFKRARRSTASERNREEPGVLTRLHAQQDRPLAARARIREGLAHFVGARHTLAGNIEDHVTGTEALRSGRPVRV